MNDKKDFLLEYIKKHGKIINKDMNEIKHLTKMKIPEQMQFLKRLEREKKIENRTNNFFEPAFYLFDADKASIEEAIDAQNDYKIRTTKAKILQHIYKTKGHFNEIEFFLDFGIPIEIQQKCIQLLIKDGKIKRTPYGFEIIKESILH